MSRLRVLELFCGIGGCSAALDSRAEIVAAIDINERAIQVYRANFRHPAQVATVESIPRACWAEWSADLWWMSPPCQPFTRRGRQRDIDDPRLAFWNVLLQRIVDLAPRYLIVENVPPFRQSRACAELAGQLEQAGYHWTAFELCPTELGIPNRRRRCFLIAGLGEWTNVTLSDVTPSPLGKFLDANPLSELMISDEMAAAYEGAMHVVDADDDRAVTACFTAAYGQSLIRSGSYLRVRDRIRRFAPTEIARLLGLSAGFRFPSGITRRQQWKLLGNSLSVPTAQWVLAHIPELAPDDRASTANGN